MAENDKNLKVEAIRVAGGLHSAHVAAGNKELKPADVVDTAKKIYEFLTTYESPASKVS
jgi:hypothetical protein